MASAFSNALDFLGVLGIYDVVLPFLLVFVVIFAILEKSKILGTEKYQGNEYSKKNLNSLIAFVVAFLVVASNQAVNVILHSIPNIFLLLMMVVFYMLLIGVFFKNGEDVFLDKGPWRTSFMIVTLIAIVLIFMNAIPLGKGTVLSFLYNQIAFNFSSGVVSAIIFLLIIIGIMLFVTMENKPKAKESSGGDD